MKKWDYLVKNRHFVQFVIKNSHISINQKKNGISKGPYAGDCHFDKSKEYYEGKVRQPCVCVE
jgi:hypothetical protein